jgi:hypothetical protein
MKRWSKLQKELYLLVSPDINFQIHCVAYPMRSQYGGTNLPRYWITLGKDILWDYPQNFVADGGVHEYYPYMTDVSDISELLREYIDTPKETIIEKYFENDKWGLTDILKAADRRIGKRRLTDLKHNTHNLAAIRIIEERLFRDSPAGTTLY